MTSQQFAEIVWQSRWNKSDPSMMSLSSGSALDVTCLMGILRMDLKKDEDIAAIVLRLRQMADFIEREKKEYDEAMTKDWANGE